MFALNADAGVCISLTASPLKMICGAAHIAWNWVFSHTLLQKVGHCP